MADTIAANSNPNPIQRLSRVTNLAGLNVRISPLNGQEGEFIRLINVDSYPIGAKRKRSGLTPLLGTADGSAITSLFGTRMTEPPFGCIVLLEAHYIIQPKELELGLFVEMVQSLPVPQLVMPF